MLLAAHAGPVAERRLKDHSLTISLRDSLGPLGYDLPQLTDRPAQLFHFLRASSLDPDVLCLIRNCEYNDGSIADHRALCRERAYDH